MKKLRLILLFCLLASYFPVHALTGIFWQPQSRDLSVSEASWTSLMRKVKKQGFDTLVVQWTRYGESFSSDQDTKQLLQKINHAQSAGLNVIVGLYADPEFFVRQKQPAAALDNYLNRLRVLDIQQIKLWEKELSTPPVGWYISAEIDDVNWRDDTNRNALLSWLAEIKNNITQHSDLPIYISSFFTGNMSPEAYHDLTHQINRIGINVWIQDGGGVGKLTEVQRALYLDRILPCSSNSGRSVSGAIHEVFTASRKTEFTASPKSKNEIRSILQRQSMCNYDNLYFSLRYLPISSGILEYDTPITQTN